MYCTKCSVVFSMRQDGLTVDPVVVVRHDFHIGVVPSDDGSQIIADEVRLRNASVI